jgi:chemotaxis protein MotA
VDKASLIGILIGVFATVFVMFEVSHGHFMMFFSMEGVMMVGLGSISVVFMAMPMDKVMAVGKYLKIFLFYKGQSPIEVINTMNQLAEKARREGILSLEAECQSISNPFLKAGLKSAIDGVSPETIEQTMRLELLAMAERHKSGKKFFDLIVLYGPGYGLVGTLIGQVGLFGNLANAEIGTLGKMLAVAVAATMYGAIIANAIAGPIGTKLQMRSAEELLVREMVLQGILSIQAGDNPRVTSDRLIAFVPLNARGSLKVAA